MSGNLRFEGPFRVVRYTLKNFGRNEMWGRAAYCAELRWLPSSKMVFAVALFIGVGALSG